jgi:hypothetical protein
MDNQLIDEALSLYNYLRIYACKAVTYSDDRVRLHHLVIRAFYRYERRKLAENRHKFNPSRTPTRARDWELKRIGKIRTILPARPPKRERNWNWDNVTIKAG